MSTIRVQLLPRNVTDKEIKIHFSKPENGGGSVRNVYYPLLRRDAIVEFDDAHTAETVSRYTHTIDGDTMYLMPVPQIQMYTTLEAKLDPTIAAFLLATEEVRDEIQYNGNIEYRHDTQTNTSHLHGNWYQLEWAWNYIDWIMQRQQRIQYRESNRTSKFKLSAKSRPDSETDDQKQCTTSRARDGDVTEPLPSNPADKDDGSESQRLESAEIYVYGRVGVTDDTRRSKVEPKTPKMVTDRKGNEDSKKTRTESKKSMTESNKTTTESIRSQIPGQAQNIDSSMSKILRDNPEDVRSLDFIHGGVTVQVYTGQITFVETDAIVNAAMGCLLNGGGVARAIAGAASPQMQAECDAYVRTHGNLRNTNVMHTSAGGMISSKVKHILHTVGPIWSMYSESDQVSHELTSTYLNCFTYANKELGLKSLALPVISSGIFGVPLELCVRSFLDAILLFTGDGGRAQNLTDIHLVNNDMENTAMTVVILRQLIEQGLHGLTAEVKGMFDKMSVSKDRVATPRPKPKESSLIFP